MAIQKDSCEPFSYDTLELKDEEFNKIIDWLNNLRLIESGEQNFEGGLFYDIIINGEDVLCYTNFGLGFIIVNHKWYSVLNADEFPIKDEVFDDLIAGKK